VARVLDRESCEVLSSWCANHKEVKRRENAERLLRRVGARILNKETTMRLTAASREWRRKQLIVKQRVEEEERSTALLWEEIRREEADAKAKAVREAELQARAEAILNRVGGRLRNQEAAMNLDEMRCNMRSDMAERWRSRVKQLEGQLEDNMLALALTSDWQSETWLKVKLKKTKRLSIMLSLRYLPVVNIRMLLRVWTKNTLSAKSDDARVKVLAKVAFDHCTRATYRTSMRLWRNSHAQLCRVRHHLVFIVKHKLGVTFRTWHGDSQMLKRVGHAVSRHVDKGHRAATKASYQRWLNAYTSLCMEGIKEKITGGKIQGWFCYKSLKKWQEVAATAARGKQASRLFSQIIQVQAGGAFRTWRVQASAKADVMHQMRRVFWQAMHRSLKQKQAINLVYATLLAQFKRWQSMQSVQSWCLNMERFKHLEREELTMENCDNLSATMMKTSKAKRRTEEILGSVNTEVMNLSEQLIIVTNTKHALEDEYGRMLQEHRMVVAERDHLTITLEEIYNVTTDLDGQLQDLQLRCRVAEQVAEENDAEIIFQWHQQKTKALAFWCMMFPKWSGETTRRLLVIWAQNLAMFYAQTAMEVALVHQQGVGAENVVQQQKVGALQQVTVSLSRTVHGHAKTALGAWRLHVGEQRTEIRVRHDWKASDLKASVRATAQNRLTHINRVMSVLRNMEHRGVISLLSRWVLNMENSILAETHSDHTVEMHEVTKKRFMEKLRIACLHDIGRRLRRQMQSELCRHLVSWKSNMRVSVTQINKYAMMLVRYLSSVTKRRDVLQPIVRSLQKWWRNTNDFKASERKRTAIEKMKLGCLLDSCTKEREVALQRMGGVVLVGHQRLIVSALVKWSKNKLEARIQKKAKSDFREMVAVMVSGDDNVQEMRDKNMAMLQENSEKTEKISFLDKKVKQLESQKTQLDVQALANMQTARRKLGLTLKKKSLVNLDRILRRSKRATVMSCVIKWHTRFRAWQNEQEYARFANVVSCTNNLNLMVRTYRSIQMGLLHKALVSWHLQAEKDRIDFMVAEATSDELKKFYRKTLAKKERLVAVHGLNRVLRTSQSIIYLERVMAWKVNQRGSVLSEGESELRADIEGLSQMNERLKKKLKRAKDLDARE